MSIFWSEADHSVISTAQELIHQYHPALRDVSILFMFRSEPASNGGREVYASTEKISPKMRALLNNADFLIWVSDTDWTAHDSKWREALIDHQLMHCCVGDDGKTYIRPHDIEEFNVIIERHGHWNMEVYQVEQSLSQYRQSMLVGIEEIECRTIEGKVFTISGAKFNQVEPAEVASASEANDAQ